MSDYGMPDGTGQKKVIKIQYEKLSAKYASQFVCDRNEEVFLLGFSTGIVEDGASGECVLPVHSRIALSEESVKKLAKLLEDALQQGAAGGARVPSIGDVG